MWHGAAKMSIRITAAAGIKVEVLWYVITPKASTATGGRRNINIDDGNYIQYEQWALAVAPQNN